MKENVIITIKSTQYDGEQSDTIETLHHGTHKIVAGNTVFYYEEILPDETGTPVTASKNILKLSGDTICVTKQGLVNTTMKFATGYVHQDAYHTPYGSFDMTLHSSSVQQTLTEDRIVLDINYSLELNGNYIADCKMCITIENQNEE